MAVMTENDMTENDMTWWHDMKGQPSQSWYIMKGQTYQSFHDMKRHDMKGQPFQLCSDKLNHETLNLLPLLNNHFTKLESKKIAQRLLTQNSCSK
jgi:hypothetical protein